MTLIELNPKYGTPYAQVWRKPTGNYIIVRHGHVAITNFDNNVNQEFLDSLSVWDPIYFKQDVKGGYYLEELNEYRLPKGFPLDELQEWFPKYKIYPDNNHFKMETIEAKLFLPPRDDIQKICLAHMLKLPPYTNLSMYTMQIIDMDTGDGKTYAAVATTVQTKGKSVIFLPISKLYPQWIKAFEDFSSIKSSDIITIKGRDKMEKLVAGEYNDKKVYLISPDTFINFIKLEGDIAGINALQQTNARNLFIDEAHKELDAVMKILALSNFKMTYLLTSSFGRANKFENRIYKKCFRFVPKTGKRLKHQVEKHIKILTFFYKYQLNPVEHKSAWRPRIGLNGKSYESVLFKGDGKKHLIPIFHNAFNYCNERREEGGKFLILSSTINGAENFKKVLNYIAPNLTVGVYHSKVSKKEKETCFDNDVIVSTVDSLSTGADISGLQFCINIATYSNAIWADQMAGRLRRNGYTNLIYIELVNRGYKQTYNQYQARLPELCKKSANGKVGEI